jgi:4-amino-4-deoxy-L-arabinose transferase-like glycosyltransferase
MTKPSGISIQWKWFRTFLMAVALLLSIGSLFHGFVGKHVDFTGLWLPEGLLKLEQFTAIYWTAFLAVYASGRRFVRPVTLAAGLSIAIIVAGPWTVFSVAVFFFGSWALGAWLVREGGAPSYLPGEIDLFRLCAGLVIVETAMYATARMGVHYRPVILVFLLLPGLIAFRRLRPKFDRLLELSRASTGSAWQVFTGGLLSYILFCSLLLALSPEVGSDALAMHLAVGTDMAAHHRFTFTPDVVSWSAMPLGADYCFAVASILGGEIAARLENFGFFLLLLAVLFSVGRRFTTRTADLFLVLAMFASTSLAQFAVDSLVVENLWALLCAAMFLALLNYYRSGRDRYLILCSLLGGGAMMTKFGSLAFLIACFPFVGYAIWQNWNRGQLGKARLLSSAALLLLAVSAIPYAIAYATTGNPVFPFSNATWKSPLLNTAANLIDFRWRAPIRSTILFDLTFKTPKYLESRVGGFGFTFLLFALPCCAAISRKWKFVVIASGLVPLIFAALTFHEVRYIRYLYPGLAILTTLMVYSFRESHRLNRGLYAILALLAVAGTGLNYYFVPAFSGYEAAFYSLTRSSREQYMQAYYRPAQAIRYLNRVGPDGSTLFVDSVDIAGLTGHSYALWWHFYPVAAAVKSADSVAEIEHVLAAYSIQYVLHSTAPEAKWHVRSVEEGRQYPWSATYVPALFNQFLETCTTPVFSAGGWEVRKIRPCKLVDRSAKS